MAWTCAAVRRMRLTRSEISIYPSVLLSALLVVLTPLVALAGDNVWTSTGPSSNNVRALAIDPSNPQVIYAGTSGGVYKSTNGGASWTVATIGPGSVQVYALGIDPSRPQTLYVGASSGLFKTTNGGSTWVWMVSGKDIRSLAVDPWNPQIIYAGTTWYNGGVLKSVNGGNSWTEARMGSDHAWALAIDPSNPLTVYAGTYGGAYKSVNGGSSTRAINGNVIGSETYVNAFAIDPSNSQTIYAGTGYGDVLKSANGGSSWSRIRLSGGIFSLAVDPSNPQTVYAGIDGGGVYKSTDGGNFWTDISAGMTRAKVYALAIDPVRPWRVYAGTDEAVFDITFPQPPISTSATFLSLGGVYVGKSGVQNLAVRNTGSANLSVSNITSADGQFAASPTSFTLARGDSQVVKVTFRPEVIKTSYAALAIAHNVGDNPAIVAVRGTGLGVPRIRLSPASLALDTVRVGSASQRTLMISNPGTDTLQVTGITVSGPDAGRFVVSPTTATIVVGDSQAVTVRFAPSSEGTKAATLAIASNDPDSGTVRLAVKGVGIPPLQIDGKIAFVSNRDGSDEVYVMNADGSNPTRLTHTNARAQGRAVDDPIWSSDGAKITYWLSPEVGPSGTYVMNADGSNPTRLADAARWSPDSSKVLNISGGVLSVMNADGSNRISLTSGLNVTAVDWSPDGSKIAFGAEKGRDPPGIYVINVDGANQTRLTPPDLMSWTPSWSPDGSKIAFLAAPGVARLHVMNADGSNLTRLTLLALIWDQVPSWSPDGSKITFDASEGDRVGVYVIDVTGSNQTRLTSTSSANWSPAWAPFRRIGAAAVGASVSRTMTVRNGGTAPIRVDNITSNDPQFTVSPSSFTLAARASQDVAVTFTPTSTGAKSALLIIAGTVRLIVNGTGVSIPAIQMSASTLAFDSTRVGATSQRTFTISNPGSGNLSVTGMTKSGVDTSQFRVSPSSFTIPVGGAPQTITVTFAPTSAGLKSATLSISHNARGSPSQVSLTGYGVRQPTVAYRPDRLSFGNVATGMTMGLPLTLYNKGNDTLKVASMTSSGKEFTLSAPRPNTTIAPGDSQVVMVSFSPAASGDITGSIAISSNDPDHKTLSVPISGVGVPLSLSVDCNPAEGNQKQTTAGGVKPGKKVSVQIFVDDVPQIKGFTVRIAFDPKTVAFVPGSFAPGSMVQGLTSLANAQKDYVEVGGAALGSGTGGGSGLLGTLSFEALSGFDKETMLRIPLVVWNRVTGGRQEIQTDIQVTFTSAGGLPGDFDSNGEIDFNDFFLFAGAFGQKATGDNARYDLDGNGDVDFGDFFIFAEAFGKKQ